jgi:hypothetical protein
MLELHMHVCFGEPFSLTGATSKMMHEGLDLQTGTIDVDLIIR